MLYVWGVYLWLAGENFTWSSGQDEQTLPLEICAEQVEKND